MNTRILIGIVVCIIGLVLVVSGFRSTEVDPWLRVEVPTVNVPLVVIGIIGMIGGGLIIAVGAIGAGQKEEDEIRQLDIVLVTTDSIPGRRIVTTLGPVQARNKPALGPGVVGIDARKDLSQKARKLGANAIVGLRIEREDTEGGGAYFVSGTAVITECER